MFTDFSYLLLKPNYNKLSEILDKAISNRQKNPDRSYSEAEDLIKSEILDYEKDGKEQKANSDKKSVKEETWNKRFYRWLHGQSRPKQQVQWQAIYKTTKCTFGQTRFSDVNDFQNFVSEVLKALKEQLVGFLKHNQDIEDLNILTLHSFSEILAKKLAIQPINQVEKILNGVLLARLVQYPSRKSNLYFQNKHKREDWPIYEISEKPVVIKHLNDNLKYEKRLQRGDFFVKQDSKLTLTCNQVIIQELIDLISDLINNLPLLFFLDRQVYICQRYYHWFDKGLTLNDLMILKYYDQKEIAQEGGKEEQRKLVKDSDFQLLKRTVGQNPKAKDKRYVERIRNKRDNSDNEIDVSSLPLAYLMRKLQISEIYQYIPNDLSLKGETKYWVGIAAEYLTYLLDLESKYYLNKSGEVFLVDKNGEQEIALT